MCNSRHVNAIIYDRKGRVLSIGQNSYVKTHPVQATYAKKVGLPDNQFLHAEIAAIVKCKDLSKAYRIFVSRWNHLGEPILAKPCPICSSAIKAAGIFIVQHT